LGAVRFESELYIMSIYFDGTDYVYTDGYQFPTVGTVCLWVRLDNTSGVQRLFGVNDWSEIRLDGNGLYNDVWKSGTTSLVTTFAADTWYHMTVSFDAITANESSFYLDGILIRTDSTNESSIGSGRFSVGCRGAGAGDIEGTVDDFRMYSTIECC